MFNKYSAAMPLATVPPELGISQKEFDKLNQLIDENLPIAPTFESNLLDPDEPFNIDADFDETQIPSIDSKSIQSKNDELLAQIESNLINLLKPYAFGIATIISSNDKYQTQNIQHFSLVNPKPKWLSAYMLSLRHSLIDTSHMSHMYNTNVSDELITANIALHLIRVFDFLKETNNELLKLLSSSITTQSLKDYSVAEAVLENWDEYFNSKIFLSESNRYEIVSSDPVYVQVLSEVDSRQYTHNIDLSNRIIIDTKKGTLI